MQSAGCRDRAQLVLVAGLVLAVTFVALALLLNTAIFAENLATRQTGGNAASAETAVSTVDTSVGKILTYVNTNNTENSSYVKLRTRFTESVENWTESSNRQLVVDGQRLQVEVVGTTEATRMVHTNASRNWTSAGHDVGWTLFRNVDAEDVRWFELNVSRKSLPEATLDTTMSALLDSAFNVRIENAANEEWRVYVFEGAATGNIYTLVEEPGEDFRSNPRAYVDFASDACLVNADHVEIDLWASQVQDVDCQELSFVRSLSGDITVSYENTTSDPSLLDTSLIDPDNVTRANGTYDILVNSTNVEWNNFHAASTDESPFTLTALGAATVTRSFGRENLDFTGTTTVAPTRIGGLGSADRPIVNFDVNDSTDTDPEFQVNWEARDPNGDLAQVEVTIEDDDGDVVYSETHVVGGSDADGSDTWTGSDNESPYVITVEVTDQEGQTDTAEQEHYADGVNDDVTVL